jgi:hypothetical protein
MVERRNGQEMQAFVPTSSRGMEGRKGMGSTAGEAFASFLAEMRLQILPEY